MGDEEERKAWMRRREHRMRESSEALYDGDGRRDRGQNATGDDKFDALRSAMRANVDRESYLLATILVDEAIAELYSLDDPGAAREAWHEVMGKAAEWHMACPFAGEEKFRAVFDEAAKNDETDWDEAFATDFLENSVAVMPKALMSLYEERIDEGTKSVLIVDAERFYPHLKEILEKNKGMRFVLTTQNDIYRRALQAFLAGHDLANAEIFTADPYRSGFIQEGFDLIFAMPVPCGTGSVERRGGGTSMTRALVRNLKENAKLVVTWQERAMSLSGEDDVSPRDEIARSCKITEIAEMPKRIFNTSLLKTYLLEIENVAPAPEDDVIVRVYVPVKAYDAAGGYVLRSHSSAGRIYEVANCDEITIDGETEVKIGELLKQKTWNISKMLSEKSPSYLQFYNSPVPKVTLGEIATVFRGRAIYEREEKGNVAVLSISNLGEYEIDFKNLAYIQENNERKISEYRLKEGDLLLPARGTVMKTAIFHDPGYPCMASVNLIVVRPKGLGDITYPFDDAGKKRPELNTVYLKIFLDSELGKKFLDDLTQGRPLMNMSHKQLADLNIPLPSEEEQREKADEYRKEYRLYKDAVDEAERRWEDALEKLRQF